MIFTLIASVFLVIIIDDVTLIRTQHFHFFSYNTTLVSGPLFYLEQKIALAKNSLGVPVNLVNVYRCIGPNKIQKLKEISTNEMD